jgi:biotin carboxylase
MKQLLVVVYDVGAAGPVDIATAARDTCDLVFVCDPADPHAAAHLDQMHQAGTVVAITDPDAEAVAKVAAALGADGLTTFSEYQIALTAAAAAECDLRFHDPETASLLTDKCAQRRALREAGVESTRFAPVDSPDDLESALSIVGIPAVLKPRNGAASVDTFLVESAAQGRAFLQDSDNAFILEERLVGDPRAAGSEWGDLVSVESIVVDGSVRSSHLTGKLPLAPPFRETGQFAPATLDPVWAEQVAALAEAALAALGIRWGTTHTEVKLTPAGPRIVEVNGRLGGYVSDVHRRAGGPDLLSASIAVALGLPLPDADAEYGRVAFRHYVAAPPYRARLDRIEGLDLVGDLPGVTLVEPRAVPGQVLDWRRGTQECLAVVYGTAADHGELSQTIRRIAATVRPAYTRTAEHETTEETRL